METLELYIHLVMSCGVGFQTRFDHDPEMSGLSRTLCVWGCVLLSRFFCASDLWAHQPGSHRRKLFISWGGGIFFQNIAVSNPPQNECSLRRYFQHAHFIPIVGVGKRG